MLLTTPDRLADQLQSARRQGAGVWALVQATMRLYGTHRVEGLAAPAPGDIASDALVYRWEVVGAGHYQLTLTRQLVLGPPEVVRRLSVRTRYRLDGDFDEHDETCESPGGLELFGQLLAWSPEAAAVQSAQPLSVEVGWLQP